MACVMSRFCGRFDWADGGRHDADAESWTAMLALLGDATVDCSAARWTTLARAEILDTMCWPL